MTGQGLKLQTLVLLCATLAWPLSTARAATQSGYAGAAGTNNWTTPANATGAPEEDPARIKQLLAGQLTSVVRWRDCMDCIKARAPEAILEVGPGRVLAGLARANGIGAELRVYGVGDLRGVERAARELASPGQ